MYVIKDISNITETVFARTDRVYRALDLGLKTANGKVVVEPADVTGYEKARASYTFQYESDDGHQRDATGTWPARVAVVRSELLLAYYEYAGSGMFVLYDNPRKIKRTR